MSTLNKKHREKYAEHARKNYKHLKMRTEPSDGKGWFKRRDIQFNHLPLPQVDKIKWLKECASKNCLSCKTQLASKFMQPKDKIETKEVGTVVPRSTNKKHTTFNSHEEKVNYIIKKFKGE